MRRLQSNEQPLSSSSVTRPVCVLRFSEITKRDEKEMTGRERGREGKSGRRQGARARGEKTCFVRMKLSGIKNSFSLNTCTFNTRCHCLQTNSALHNINHKTPTINNINCDKLLLCRYLLNVRESNMPKMTASNESGIVATPVPHVGAQTEGG